MFPLSTQNICWNSEGFAVHAQCGDGFYFVPSLFSRVRNCGVRQQLLEDRFMWKSENCLQGIPAATQQRSGVSISGSGTF